MEKETFEFKYKFPENYNPVYVNGAFGGVSSKGEIVVNFFLERHALPRSETHEIIQGKLSKDFKREPENQSSSAIRYVEPGIILSLDHAKSIHNWLGEKIEQLELITKKMKKENNTK